MGVTKSDLFSSEQNELANIAKVLGHPARIAILERLLNEPSGCICNDFVADLALAQPTISQHLSALKNAGIIQGKISGTSVCYCIHPENWQRIEQLIGGFFQRLSTTTSACCSTD
jgi:ArsR family transcriptional regulator, arsenate/arsenite/antimonite-responsive transcriptional repressor